MSRAEFIQLVWQMRQLQKQGKTELARDLEFRVDNYLDTQFEQQIKFE